MDGLSGAYARYLPALEDEMRAVVALAANVPSQVDVGQPPPAEYVTMLTYHMGWTDPGGKPVDARSGKRVRPLMCLLVCEATGGDWTQAVPVAAALELAHNFSLVHDDIQDEGELRRGQPTVWREWGVPLAINAGDALFTLAHLAALRSSERAVPADRALAALRVLDETYLHLTLGQHLDLTFERMETVTREAYLRMIEAKSAALLAASVSVGALLAGADEEKVDAYRAFGLNLGMAFQVTDDILGIWGDAQTGKSSASDLQARKKTLPVLVGLDESPELRDLYAGDGPLGADEVRQAVHWLEAVGAREEAEKIARQFSEEALDHLERAAPQGQAGDWLRTLADELLRRDR